ncbi:MAG: glycosyltransferase [Patescibacteria group bacterium]|jgi:glycosyltransferase involved in cell wall biosynthesis
MKIIYIENVRIPSERAHAYQIVQTCAWFARLGHEVTLVNPDRAGDRDVFDVYELERDLFRHVRLPVVDPLSWKWFPFKKIAYALQRFSFSLALKKWQVNQTADVWYTRDPAMVDILKRSDRKFALELHDRPDAKPARWNRVKLFVQKFIVITKGLSETLRQLDVHPAKIRVAPDGYDPKDFLYPADHAEERRRLEIPDEAFVAIYTGSFYPWKGVDLVVGGWNRTSERAHLVLIGGPDADRRRLESLIAPAAKNRVHILPTVDHTQAIRALYGADIGLLTTSDAEPIGRLYTSPLKQFEYLAAGLPVLASDVPSSHEVLTNDVAYFYPLTEDGFVNEINKVILNVDWRVQASERARRLVEPYTWEARSRTILDHIASV